jgi:transcriptional regulator of acetoin/glycerol metabolism
MTRESASIMAKSAILGALSKTGGNITRAAKVLGISRATLQNKMKAYGLRKNKE